MENMLIQLNLYNFQMRNCVMGTTHMHTEDRHQDKKRLSSMNFLNQNSSIGIGLVLMTSRNPNPNKGIESKIAVIRHRA